MDDKKHCENTDGSYNCFCDVGSYEDENGNCIQGKTNDGNILYMSGRMVAVCTLTTYDVPHRRLPGGYNHGSCHTLH